MTMTDPNDNMLDDLFAEARRISPPVGGDLMARVLADAAAAQAPARLWTRLFEMLGGWPALGGLAAATVAGVWIGVSPPAPVADLTAALLGETVSVSLFTDGVLSQGGLLADG